VQIIDRRRYTGATVEFSGETRATFHTPYGVPFDVEPGRFCGQLRFEPFLHFGLATGENDALWALFTFRVAERSVRTYWSVIPASDFWIGPRSSAAYTPPFSDGPIEMSAYPFDSRECH